MGALVCVGEKRLSVKKERNASPVIATNEETLVQFLFFKRLWQKMFWTWGLVYVPPASHLILKDLPESWIFTGLVNSVVIFFQPRG